LELFAGLSFPATRRPADKFGFLGPAGDYSTRDSDSVSR